jgi:hypothetical protein
MFIDAFSRPFENWSSEKAASADAEGAEAASAAKALSFSIDSDAPMRESVVKFLVCCHTLVATPISRTMCFITSFDVMWQACN